MEGPTSSNHGKGNSLTAPRASDLLSPGYGKLAPCWRPALATSNAASGSPVVDHGSCPKQPEAPRVGEQGCKRLAAKEDREAEVIDSDEEDIFDDTDEIDEWGAGSRFWQEREEARLRRQVSDDDSDDDDDSDVEGWQTSTSGHLQQVKEHEEENLVESPLKSILHKRDVKIVVESSPGGPFTVPKEMSFGDLMRKLAHENGGLVSLKPRNPSSLSAPAILSEEDLAVAILRHKEHHNLGGKNHDPLVQPRSAIDPENLSTSQQLDHSCPANIEGYSKPLRPPNPSQFRFFQPPTSAPVPMQQHHQIHLFDFLKSSLRGTGVVGGRSGMGLVAVESPRPPRRRFSAPQPPTIKSSSKPGPSGLGVEVEEKPVYMWETNGALADAPLTITAKSLANTNTGVSYFPGAIATKLSTARFRHGAVDPLDASDMPTILWQKGKKLGEGSFGSVFSALDLMTGLRFAIKQVTICNEEDGGMGQKARKQGRALQREIYYLESLSHPNIIKILGTQRSKHKLTIFLEYASEGSLESLIKEFGPMTEGIIQAYSRQILDGLRYLHKNKIIHRDIKTSNILIDKGLVKLADFGASKRIGDHMLSQSDKGITGTLPYMAPEVLQSDNETGYGRRADIWSFGITVVEMAYGEHPFKDIQTAVMVVCEEVYKLPTLPEGDFTHLAHDFLSHCLVRDPHARWTAAKLLRHEFVSPVEDRSVALRAVALSQRQLSTQSGWSEADDEPLMLLPSPGDTGPLPEMMSNSGWGTMSPQACAAVSFVVEGEEDEEERGRESPEPTLVEPEVVKEVDPARGSIRPSAIKWADLPPADAGPESSTPTPVMNMMSPEERRRMVLDNTQTPYR